MDSPFKTALKKVVAFLENHQLKHALIGGIANQVWGQARFTYDIDLKVLVPNLDYELVRKTIMAAFPEPAHPDLPVNSLIVSVKINEIIVDFLLTTPGYEEHLVKRAIRYEIDDLSLWLCTPEDLIIQKAIAGRPKDWQDIEGIIIEQFNKLDQKYLKNWMQQFADILEKPEIMNQFQQIYQKVSNLQEG